MAVINIRGDIISNDDKWIYDWFEYESTCPKDVKDVIATAKPDESIDVYINSGGGNVLAGQEIYSVLNTDSRVKLHVESLAGSAAGIIAMAGKCTISPVAMIMIHNVAMSGVSGDYHEMQKNAEILQRMNEALANAFVRKSGKSEKEILEMMDKETWLTANQCLEYGFVDEIGQVVAPAQFTNAFWGMRVTAEMREKAIKERADKEKEVKMLIEDLDDYGI